MTLFELCDFFYKLELANKINYCYGITDAHYISLISIYTVLQIMVVHVHVFMYELIAYSSSYSLGDFIR